MTTPDERGDGSDERRPDHDRRPSRLVLAERREVEPVRDRAQVGPEPGRAGRVLHHFTGRAVDVDLLAVGPGILEERPQVAERPHRPLIGLVDRRLLRFVDRPARPAPGGAIHHRPVDQPLRAPIVCVDQRCAAATPARTASSAAGAHAVDRPAVEAVDPDLGRRFITAESGLRLFRRDADRVGGQRRRALQAVLGTDLGIAPIHHHDAGDEPQQEDHRQADTEPAVDEDQRAQCPTHGGCSTARRTPRIGLVVCEDLLNSNSERCWIAGGVEPGAASASQHPRITSRAPPCLARWPEIPE